MHPNICHQAIVTKVEPSKLTLTIESVSACSACTAKSMCHLTEKKDKQIIVNTVDATKFQEGESVVLEMEEKKGMKAVLLAYVLPLVSGLLALLITILFTSNEGIMGLCTIAGIAIYYCILWVWSPRLNGRFEFSVHK
ncbi:MAG: SoxR reducing system RseC family protein [Bacteroidales bacterium]